MHGPDLFYLILQTSRTLAFCIFICRILDMLCLLRILSVGSSRTGKICCEGNYEITALLSLLVLAQCR